MLTMHLFLLTISQCHFISNLVTFPDTGLLIAHLTMVITTQYLNRLNVQIHIQSIVYLKCIYICQVLISAFCYIGF